MFYFLKERFLSSKALMNKLDDINPSSFDSKYLKIFFKSVLIGKSLKELNDFQKK